MDDPLELAVGSDSDRELFSFQFIDADRYVSEKPYYVSGHLDEVDEVHRTNIGYVCKRDIPAFDLRGYETMLDLEQHGIAYVNRSRPLPLSLDDQDKLEPCLEELAFVIRQKLQATIVVCYDYRVSWS